MPRSSSLRAPGAVRTSSGQASGRRPSLSPADRLEELSFRLDELIRDVRLGTRSHREHERHVEEAEAIGAGIRNVFRAPSGAAADRPPLAQRGGKAWW